MNPEVTSEATDRTPPSRWPGRVMRGLVIATLGFSAACFAYADIKDRQARAGYPPDEIVKSYYQAAMRREAARTATTTTPHMASELEASAPATAPVTLPATGPGASTSTTYTSYEI